MKKNRLSKTALFVATLLFAAACGGGDPVPGPIIGGDTPEEPEGDVPEELITLDGDFSDWEALKPEYVIESVAPADAAYPGAKRLKVYVNKTHINLYVEFDGSEEVNAGVLDVYMDTDMKFDGDGNATTGAGTWIWKNDGSDMLIQGMIKSEETGEYISYDADISKYSGTPLGDEWEWTPVAPAGTGATASSNAVLLPNGNHAIEVSIVRAAAPDLGKQVRLGVMFEKTDWSGECGMLPAHSALAENEYDAAEKLLVNMNGHQGGDVPDVPGDDVKIAIDGDFADWTALSAANVKIAAAPEDPFYTGAKMLKATSDATYLYLYVEFDGSTEAGVGILDLFVDTDLSVDGEGNATTGTGSWPWLNNGADLMFQGAMFNEAGKGAWDSPVYQYTGTPLADEWAWTEIVAAGMGATSSSDAVKLENGNKAMEIAVMRAAVPGLGKKAMLGIMLEKADWSGECGILPTNAAKISDAGREFDASKMMSISLK
ncbi:MAG: hypothetical protein RR330_03300 [Alistipes sp.]